MEKPIRIIQTSYVHTGSTLLSNILYGFFCCDKPIQVQFMPVSSQTEKLSKNLIVKSHYLGIRRWIHSYNQFNMFFILSERDQKYPPHFYNMNKILIIDYNTLLESDTNPVEVIVENVYKKIRDFLPLNFFESYSENIMKKNAVRRVKTMNALYENIKNKGFSYFDSFYLLHGNHRNREDTKIPEQSSQNPRKKPISTSKRILKLNLL
jgi:signal recognition particle subunit SEC65